MSDGQSEACRMHDEDQAGVQRGDRVRCRRQTGTSIQIVTGVVAAIIGPLARVYLGDGEHLYARAEACEKLPPYVDDHEAIDVGDWVRAVYGTDTVDAESTGRVIDRAPCTLEVKWETGAAASRGRGVSLIAEYRCRRISGPLSDKEQVPYLVRGNGGTPPRGLATSHCPAAHAESNARRLLRMVHQWAVCDGRYRGGNLWREVERELS